MLVLYAGCSAGGLATLIHCDYFRDHLPKDADVKCVSDGGFFLNVYVTSFYNKSLLLHNIYVSVAHKFQCSFINEADDDPTELRKLLSM